MKKPLKISLIITASLAAAIVIAALILPPAAKHYVEKHDRELIGRSIRMERLRFNLFTGRLRIDGLRIGGADDSATFFRLDSFDMRMRLWPLLRRRVDVRRIAFTGPDLKIYQRGTDFSFDDILARFRSDTTAVTEAAEPSRPWEVGIYGISIRDGHIFYKDLLLDAAWGLNDVNLAIPGIYFSGAKTDVGAVLNFAEGGSLETRVAYDIETSDFDIGLKLDGFTLGSMLPYFRPSLDISEVRGRLSADIRLQGDAEHLLSLRASGDASLAGFSLHDARQRPVVAVDTLAVQLAEGDLGRMRFVLDRFYVGGFSAFVELTPEGNNISALMKAPAASTAAAAAHEAAPEAPAASAGSQVSGTQTAAATDEAPATADEPSATGKTVPTLRIADLEIARSSVVLHDRTLHTPFEYRIGDIRMRSRNFDPAARNNLIVDARMQKTGAARLRWEGTLDNLNDHNITLWLSNVALHDFSPYCEHYTAYPLTQGNLTFRSQNVIRNRNLDGTNHLDLFEPGVDKKRKELNPEMNVPLKLGLYVLKDKKGHVKMDLPVRGSLDSPEFSYRKIVLKAIGNVLLKVVTAPFSFLGGHKDNLEYIPLEARQYAFTSEQYASLDKIAQLLQEKPEMGIGLTQRINLRRALPAQAADALRMAYAAHLQGEDTSGAARASAEANGGTADNTSGSTQTAPGATPTDSGADAVDGSMDNTSGSTETAATTSGTGDSTALIDASDSPAAGVPDPEPTAATDPGADNLAAASGALTSDAPATSAGSPASDRSATASDAPGAQAGTPSAPAPKPGRLSMLEYEKIQQLDIRSPEIMDFADSLLTARGIAPQGLSPEQKALTLFRDEAVRQLRRMMEMRDRAVSEYMLTTHRLAAPAFRLQPLDSAALETYSGRDRYTISLGVDGESVEVGEQGDGSERSDGTGEPAAGDNGQANANREANAHDQPSANTNEGANGNG